MKEANGERNDKRLAVGEREEGDQSIMSEDLRVLPLEEEAGTTKAFLGFVACPYLKPSPASRCKYLPLCFLCKSLAAVRAALTPPTQSLVGLAPVPLQDAQQPQGDGMDDVTPTPMLAGGTKSWGLHTI
eukprot:gene15146-21208_t